MKKVLTALLAALLLLFVVGCGSNKSKGDDANSGDDGNTADSGDDGNTADSGDDGNTANSGDDGDTADSGDDGNTADSGDDGDTADSGDDGNTANTGDDGDTADTGDDGNTADSGDDGDTADTGDDGNTGDDDSTSVCGNGIVEEGEICDGNKTTCKELGLGDSEVSIECNENCNGWLDANLCKRTYTCPSKPEYSVWNSVSEYEQTWDGEKWEPADSITQYNEETSDEPCRFMCAEDVEWDKDELKCKDPFIFSHAGLDWSKKTSSTKNWSSAVTYCKNLGGHLPTISELRTLIQDCPSTETGGACGVIDSCLESSCWSDSCAGHYPEVDNTGKYSVFGDTGWFWSASEQLDTQDAWRVDFKYGRVVENYKNGKGFVRCVR
ncbi:MAG: DUF1566 domain-containing protein [bacterium]